MQTVVILILGLSLYATAEETTKEVSVNRSKLLEKLFYTTIDDKKDIDELWRIVKPCFEYGLGQTNITFIEALIQLNADIEECRAIKLPNASTVRNFLERRACLRELPRPKQAVEEVAPIFKVCYSIAKKELRYQAEEKKDAETTTVSEP